MKNSNTIAKLKLIALFRYLNKYVLTLFSFRYRMFILFSNVQFNYNNLSFLTITDYIGK